MSAQIGMMRDQLSVVNEKLDEHTDKLDVLLADVVEPQDRADTIWEKVSTESMQTKKDIHNLKQAVGPSS